MLEKLPFVYEEKIPLDGEADYARFGELNQRVNDLYDKALRALSLENDDPRISHDGLKIVSTVNDSGYLSLGRKTIEIVKSHSENETPDFHFKLIEPLPRWAFSGILLIGGAAYLSTPNLMDRKSYELSTKEVDRGIKYLDSFESGELRVSVALTAKVPRTTLKENF